MTLTLKITTCVLAIAMAGALKWIDPPTTQPAKTEAQAAYLESVRTQLSTYKTWTLVNPEPVLMDPIVAADCAAPNLGARSPHSNKYVAVYVNDAGRHAMMFEKYPSFPEGSIIVKEKLDSKTSQVPELLTIMIKRGEGYDPGNGNWEYLVMDGRGSRVEKPASVEKCQSCHLVNKRTDYVSRIYLPKEIREKLK